LFGVLALENTPTPATCRTLVPSPFVSARTENTAANDLASALQERGITVESPGDPDTLVASAAGTHVRLRVTATSAPTRGEALDLLSRAKTPPGDVPVMVGDRLSESVRTELAQAGWGWLDRRGALRLVTGGVFVDAQVARTTTAGHTRREVLNTEVGREVALKLLTEPFASHGVRELATSIGRAPSAVSVALRDLQRQSLVTTTNTAESEALFEALVEQWRPRSVLIATMPDPDSVASTARLRGGLDDLHDDGWAMTGVLALVAWGGRAAVTPDYPRELYVPDERVLTAAVDRFGTAATARSHAALLLVAPARTKWLGRSDAPQPMLFEENWPLAHPLLVALDLARDGTRGAEMLAGWTPPPPYHRVW